MAVHGLGEFETAVRAVYGAAQEPELAQALDYVVRDVRIAVYRIRVKVLVEEVPQSSHEDIQRRLLFRRRLRERKDSIRIEHPRVESLGKAWKLCAGEEQLFG